MSLRKAKTDKRFAGFIGRPEETFESGKGRTLGDKRKIRRPEEDESSGVAPPKRCPTKTWWEAKGPSDGAYQGRVCEKEPTRTLIGRRREAEWE